MKHHNSGWIPEREKPDVLGDFLESSRYDGDYPWDKTDKPPVVRWEDFEPIVRERKIHRDIQRNDGQCLWPWVIAKHFGIPWVNPNQGNLGTCAGFAADSASSCAVLQHKADSVGMEFVPTNPYPAWVLGRKDANYRGGGASMSMVLSGINKYGRFPVSVAGTYAESIRKGVDWKKYANEAERFQSGCCYIGGMDSDEMFQAIMLCVAAGFPVAFGGSTAVSNTPTYRKEAKTGTLRGSWMHATALVAYREIAGEPYLAHLNSWGNCYGTGRYEQDPGSVIWLSESNVKKMCRGSYRDAFAITYAESGAVKTNWDLAPIEIHYPEFVKTRS